MFAVIRQCGSGTGKGLIKDPRNLLINSYRHKFGGAPQKKPPQKFGNRARGPGKETSRLNTTQIVLAGGSVLGLGALSYYGSSMNGVDQRVTIGLAWPQHVRQRVRDTYFYFASSLVVTAGAASAVLRNPVIMGLARSQGTGMFIGAMVGLMMLSNVVRNLPYQPGTLSPKHVAWLGYCFVVAILVAPMSALGGPLLIRAALNTGGMLAGLSAVAFCSPSDQFLQLGGPLAMGFGVMLVASLLPGTSSMALTQLLMTYGGLALFGAFLLYNNGKLIHSAEQHPSYRGAPPFDPIGASIGLYIHTVNAFAVMGAVMSQFS